MRHDVYYDMLSHLTLSPKHHNDLLSRGLSEERISQNMYRSLPSGTSARRLLAGMLSDFHDLEGIPGFYVDKDGFWNISGHSGLLVPYCTMDGYIQGLQVRLDDEKTRSGSTAGSPAGPPPRSPMPRVDSCYRES